MDAETSRGSGSPRRGPSWSGMGIRGRLLILLAVPLLGLVSLTGFGTYQGVRDWASASELKTRTGLAANSFALAEALQDQRHSLVVDGKTDDDATKRIESARARIEQSRGDLTSKEQVLAKLVLTKTGAAEMISGLALSGNAAINTISPAVNDAIDLGALLLNPDGAVDPRPSSSAESLVRARAAATEEHDRVITAAKAEQIALEDYQTLVALSSAQTTYLGLAASTSPDEMAIRVDRVKYGVVGTDGLKLTGPAASESGELADWRDGATSRVVEMSSLASEAMSATTAVVNNLVESSRRLMVGAGAAMVLVIMLTVALLGRALRSIAKPLTRLASRAEQVAAHDLPEVVEAKQADPSGDHELPEIEMEGAAEVAAVAAAFNDIQSTALRLAAEQAVLRVNQAEALTNLGRRNQTLVARQLDYLSSIQADESNPEFLEHLFRLDHLASRMRRNSESLLVLAGSETARGRRAPARVAEVVRAAMGEVEDFERVDLGAIDDAVVIGPVVIDIVHLLAELMENGLSFSPPDSRLVIGGEPLSQGGYQLSVTDAGVGMSDAEFKASNRRLSGVDEVDGMPTRYLGQYVMAKLAKRIGAVVHLSRGAGGRGVQASVILPSSAIVGHSLSEEPAFHSVAARESTINPVAARETARPVPMPSREAAVSASSTVSASSAAKSPEPPIVGMPVIEAPLAQPAAAYAPPPATPPAAPLPKREPVTREPVTRELAGNEPVVSEHSGGEQVPSFGGQDSGLLQRRVPGASLADRHVEGANVAGPPPERSAQQVRSALASFQAGRRRGQLDPDQPSAATPIGDQLIADRPDSDGPDADRPNTDQFDSRQLNNEQLNTEQPDDWRSQR